MSYTPTEWKTGDIISAEKMNKIEKQLTPVIIKINNNQTIDYSYNDIKEAVESGRNILLYYDSDYYIPIHSMKLSYDAENGCAVSMWFYDFDSNHLTMETYLSNSKDEVLTYRYDG